MPRSVPGRIRVGVGGWTYEPWRGVFFPEGLAQARELAYASTQLTTIEINGTYYRTQSPSTFAKWKAETPDGFVFAVKALRYTTNRRVLAEAGESVGKFLGSGLTGLGDKLGPILWQFAPTKKFDEADFAAFLELLPERQDGVRLRHAVEVRHDSFRDPAFVALLRRHGVAVVFADSDSFPAIPDPTADFVYARLQQTREKEETGYAPAELDRWAAVAKAWAAGETPEALPYVAPPVPAAGARDVFVYMISGAKVRAPAAAKALIERVA
ncbi:MAG TPA: DUF72 domain-containing protein [Caulobacteraceae bacterium]|jgi:uncharacterized protein YecE (DUF72 family)|nr:DUF72 domain-containing protein [Caulobacteraceae bacterium]